MRAGIIAAGEGSRLAAVGAVKPLIPVAGKPLIHWIADGLRTAGASALTVLTNSRGAAVPQSLAASFPGTSRSGATILFALCLGIARPAAIEFSFLVGVPTLLAAGVYKLFKAWKLHELGGENWGLVLISSG